GAVAIDRALHGPADRDADPVFPPLGGHGKSDQGATGVKTPAPNRLLEVGAPAKPHSFFHPESHAWAAPAALAAAKRPAALALFGDGCEARGLHRACSYGAGSRARAGGSVSWVDRSF